MNVVSFHIVTLFPAEELVLEGRQSVVGVTWDEETCDVTIQTDVTDQVTMCTAESRHRLVLAS